jgi:hypothetical protein
MSSAAERIENMGIKERPSGHSADAVFTKPRFGSPDAVEAWEKKCKANRERQKVAIAVSPGCSVETVGGVSRKAGEEVTVQELGGPVNLDQLAKIGVVLHLNEHELKINTGVARHVVLQSHTMPGRRIADVGDVVEASDYHIDDEPERTYADPVTGRITTRPAVEYPSGEEKLRELVKRGFIEERKTRAKVQAAIKAARGE